MKENYVILKSTRVIGDGAFGKVFKTVNKHDNSIEVAIKVINKEELQDNLNIIMEEIRTLNMLDHPNIVKYYETYNDSKYIYLVMEYVNGIPLYDKIC